MTDDYELTINYPPTEDGWIDPNLDDEIIEIVGRDTVGSGAGPLTGGRDLHFSFSTRIEAETAQQALETSLGAAFKWDITHATRTIAMGQFKPQEEVQ